MYSDQRDQILDALHAHIRKTYGDQAFIGRWNAEDWNKSGIVRFTIEGEPNIEPDYTHALRWMKTGPYELLPL